MTVSETSENQLEAQLEMLRAVNSEDSAQRVQDGIATHTRQRRRQVIFASVGACVAAIATLQFVLLGDPFGYFALAPVTVVFVFTAWRSAGQAAGLASLTSGKSLLASWRAELHHQLRQTLVAPVIAMLFGSLTAWVVWHVGAVNFKSSIFLLTAAGVLVFAAYQFLVMRPLLQRELEMLKADE